jgi:hypothetical protein
MSQIYSKAHLTIAASASNGALEGCFRNNSKYEFAKYTHPYHNGQNIDVYMRSKVDHSAWAQGSLPLLGRGWASQERLLSQRLVHFTEEELIWECKANIDCECATIRNDPKASYQTFVARTASHKASEQMARACMAPGRGSFNNTPVGNRLSKRTFSQLYKASVNRCTASSHTWPGYGKAISSTVCCGTVPTTKRPQCLGTGVLPRGRGHRS